MWSVVKGYAWWELWWVVMGQVFFTIKNWIQCTLGLLSLYMPMCFAWSCPPQQFWSYEQKTSTACLRSDLVALPFGLIDDTMLALMSCGHGSWNTVGVWGMFNPIIMLSMPFFDAVMTLTTSGHPITKLQQVVGEETDSCKKMQHYWIAVNSLVLSVCHRNTTGRALLNIL